MKLSIVASHVSSTSRGAKTSRLRPVLSVLIFVFLAHFTALPARAATIVARHGLSSAQYQQAVTDLSKQGYRLTCISGYQSGGSARYAALWVKKTGPALTARHGLTSQQYQDAFTDLGKQGYRLTFINGYEVGGDARYAAIWEKKAGPASAARHGLTAAQYQKAVDDYSKQGMALSHVSAFSVKGSSRFAAIFEKSGPLRVARHGLTAAQYQKAFDDFGKQGYRLKVVSGYRDGNSDRYAAIWAKSGGPQSSARHGIPSAHYQSVFDNYYYQSWEPQYIEAFNSANGVRFNGVWENSTFSAQDLALIRNKAEAYMKANDIPGLSLAVSKDERLVYAASFGYADKEKGEPVGPAHRFRIASVSKPITQVAIARVIKDTNLTAGSKVFGSNSVLGAQYATPSNNKKIEDITIDHLLQHRSGFVNVNKDGENKDPMFNYSGTTHKGLIEWTLKEYPLGFDPGTDNQYSNFGYCVLGRVIEAKTGKTYESYVRSAILLPAGASDMVIGGDKEADRKSNEVKYYGGGAYSSVKPVRFDSHGGWIATPIDLLRFMKHESVLSTNYGFNGWMSGTTAVLKRSSDGFTYAATTNTTGSNSTDDTNRLNAMMQAIVDGVSKWPGGDLF